MNQQGDGEVDKDFEALLEYLKRSRGFDFTGYKRASLRRRVLRRMQAVHVENFADYTDFLEVHPEEFGELFDTILINVTGFFRDTAAWDQLRQQVIPQIVASKGQNDPVRVWCVGCATGEEAYTLAIVFAEGLGWEGYKARVKIYATDVDENALAKARQATYSNREVHGVPPDLLEKYFEAANNRYSFNKDLRRSIIFGKHNLIQDAPISRIDVLSCRNTLMYFNAETQSRVLDRFHFALSDQGFLFLGKVETLLSYGDTFAPFDALRRIFVKVSKGESRQRPILAAKFNSENSDPPQINSARIREAAFDTLPTAHVLIDHSGHLLLANERARTLFSLGVTDVGRPLQDLEFSYKPVELRSCIERATRENQIVTLRDVEWRPSGAGAESSSFDVVIRPLPGVVNHGAVVITFNDITDSKRLQAELHRANRQLESAYEELQSTNEELETTNEELQSTIEELETTNEELQSTNEELETMNEELQSTNLELQTLNDELQNRSTELNNVNAFLESILSSLRGAVVVLDGEFIVRVWNHRAEDYWGLRTNEVVGKHFLNLDIGLPVEQLRPCIKTCLSSESDGRELTLEATNRRGKQISCRVSCFPLVGKDHSPGGVILIMDEVDGATTTVSN